MPHITAEVLRATVLKYAAQYPEHVYQPPTSDGVCRYVDGGPDCLFGHVFVDLGVPLERLKGFDSGSEGPGLSVRQVLEILSPSLDEDTKDWAGKVQRLQDRGYSWGNAVRVADKAFSGTLQS